MELLGDVEAGESAVALLVTSGFEEGAVNLLEDAEVEEDAAGLLEHFGSEDVVAL